MESPISSIPVGGGSAKLQALAPPSAGVLRISWLAAPWALGDNWPWGAPQGKVLSGSGLQKPVSMAWVNGKSTGNHRFSWFSHEIWWFSCNCALQPIHWQLWETPRKWGRLNQAYEGVTIPGMIFPVLRMLQKKKCRDYPWGFMKIYSSMKI